MNDNVTNFQDERLNRTIAELDWDMQPDHDLWPNIESAIRFSPKSKARRQNYWAPLAIAASLFLAVGAVSMSLMTIQRADHMKVMQASMVEFQQSQIALIEQQHQLVRAQFLVLFEQGDGQVDPLLISDIKNVLNTIDGASSEIKKAIATQPFSNNYPSMLARTYQQESNLLNKISSKQTKSI